MSRRRRLGSACLACWSRAPQCPSCGERGTALRECQYVVSLNGVNVAIPNVPGESCACHSPSGFETGKFVLSAMLLEEPKSAPKKGMLGIDRWSVTRCGLL